MITKNTKFNSMLSPNVGMEQRTLPIEPLNIFLQNELSSDYLIILQTRINEHRLLTKIL
jgi:hypothetical protein